MSFTYRVRIDSKLKYNFEWKKKKKNASFCKSSRRSFHFSPDIHAALGTVKRCVYEICCNITNIIYICLWSVHAQLTQRRVFHFFFKKKKQIDFHTREVKTHEHTHTYSHSQSFFVRKISPIRKKKINCMHPSDLYSNTLRMADNRHTCLLNCTRSFGY